MAAYAALVSLMNNLEQIQHHTRLLIHFDQTQSQSLLDKVNFLVDFLETYDYRAAGEEIKDLEIQIANAAYAAEDIVETHVVDRIMASKGETETCNTISPSSLQGLDQVMADLDSIMEEAMKIKGRRKIDSLQTRKSPVVAPSITPVPAGKNTTVGFDVEIEWLTERILSRRTRRQVIPIVGMGGIGKTTLAKTVYEKFTVMQFDLLAWVTISQEYDLKRILVELLSTEFSEMSENQLGQELFKRLSGRRYLLVLDDMWSAEAWEMLRMFLPDNNNGSTIIVTTRESSVSTIFGSSSLEMSFLNEDQSWNLFCNKVFGPKGCPLEFEEVGRKIVKNCKGLPLAIVVIGGLLAKSERTKSYWDDVARDTKTFKSLNSGEMSTNILSLSYHNLPIRLKPCFLYMGVFPEDEEITVSGLIKLWVGEGFIKQYGSFELEMIAIEYLDDLIGRNLIQVHRRGLSGKIKSCKIHGLLRDLSLEEARKEKFIHIHDTVQLVSSQRRISVHRSSSDEGNIKVLDTLKSGSMGRSLICYVPEILPLHNLRLLRVLKVNDTNQSQSVKYRLDDVFQLVNSRFIAVNPIKHPMFPSSVCLLWNLQILIVKGNAEGFIVPSEIWEMTELRHIQFENKLYLPDPPSKQMNKRVVMKNLRTLKGVEDFRCTDEVVKRIPNIKKLKICNWRNFTGEFGECRLKNLSLMNRLESLTCSFSKSDLLSNLAFPSSLQKLSLEGCGLRWEEMARIGSLPYLEVLKLKFDAFVGPEWLTVEGEFLCLKYLEILGCDDLVRWVSDSDHFPSLEHLFLSSLNKLAEIPAGFGDIDKLQSIRLEHCSNSAVISAKEIVQARLDMDDKRLQVQVFCFKNTAQKSLASDNFQVEAW